MPTKKNSITHCVNGHEFTPENTYLSPNGRRGCKTCRAKAVKKLNRPVHVGKIYKVPRHISLRLR